MSIKSPAERPAFKPSGTGLLQRYRVAQIYRYIDVMITHYKMTGDHNVDVSIDLGHTVFATLLKNLPTT